MAEEIQSGRPGRLLEIVGGALELEPGARGTFLRQACGSDAALYAEAESLLHLEEPARGYMARPAIAGYAGTFLDAKDTPPPTATLASGQMLDGFRVVSLLGVGGMGEVYLAEDLDLGRPVAIKLIKAGMASETLLRRFEREKRILAGLNDPHIARLHGGAVTPGGLPYLIMEYVEGERLDEYCDKRHLSIEDRLALFRKVCAAVAHAHQHLVVHRDLKPANIRVTPEGEPKLLDFGIATLLDPEIAPDAQQTVTMFAAMTPGYASPEQLRGDPITTASDVYSLGVVLYELLTGQRPYPTDGRRHDQLAREICERDPPRLSTVVATGYRATHTPASLAASVSSPERLRRQFTGDLDNIVAMAMRKEPARRYPSVLALSEDIRRHGEGLPVNARPDTLAYRADKFVRRNKAAVAAGALVTLALIGGLVATTLQARRADRRFEDVRRLAHSILFEVEPKMATQSGNIPARSLLVQRALEYLDSLSREAGSRRDLQRELAAAYEKVGDVQGLPTAPNLGDRPGARTSYLKARSLRQALVDADGRDAPARHELAVCDTHLGVVLWWLDDTAGAQKSLDAALALERRLVAGAPRSAEFRLDLATVLFRLGDIPSWNNQSAEALSLYGQALAILQPLAREHPENAEMQATLARCLANAANAERDSGDYPGAMQNLSSSREIMTRLTLQEPGNTAFQSALWFVLYTEATTWIAQKQPGPALKLCPAMLEVAGSLAKADPENDTIQHNFAVSHFTQSVALMQSERWAEASAALQAAFDIDSRPTSKASGTGDNLRACGNYRVAMGRAHVHLGQAALAETDAQAAQALLEAATRLAPDNDIMVQDLIRAYDFRGDLCEARADPAQARQWFQRALDTLHAHAAMSIAAEDREGWAALGKKLAQKTAPAAAVSPTPGHD